VAERAVGHRTVLNNFLNTVAFNKDGPAITVEYYHLSLSGRCEVGEEWGKKSINRIITILRKNRCGRRWLRSILFIDVRPDWGKDPKKSKSYGCSNPRGGAPLTSIPMKQRAWPNDCWCSVMM
jgi:hypothetical protein